MTTFSPIYSTAEIRAIEQAAGTDGLMEKAGLAAATLAKDLLGEAGDTILVIAGKGNNGGDALVAARYLKAWWFKVIVVFTSERAQLPTDAAAAWDAWIAAGGTVETTPPDRHYDLIIDGLFGIGLSKPVQGHDADLIEVMNLLGAPILALDIPSGLCANTGQALGTAVVASHTLTFLGYKPGLFTLDGPDHAGEVIVTDLGVDASQYVPAKGALLDAPAALPAPRRRNAHKGYFGSVGILGGDATMTGAVLLAGRAALLGGAGRVYVGPLDTHAPSVDVAYPELMIRPPKAVLDLNHLSALVVGPGLGRSDHAAKLLLRAIHLPVPLILDADALHLVAEDAALGQLLIAREHTRIMTPHPGEAAALLHCSTAEIQADRVQSALKIARQYQAITVLKGCGTVIAMPDGHWVINHSGNPGMSVAGMGDVLCGLIAALIAQGLHCAPATCTGVHVHGRAGDTLAEQQGEIGMTASELILEMRQLLNQQ
jgi:hydroxyethylthiazole kinase-like uncharacterized protein yjeF